MATTLYDASAVPDGEAFLAEVLHSATHHALVAVDTDGRIVMWNEGARRMFGYEPEEMLGRVHLSALYPAEDRLHGALDASLRRERWEGSMTCVRKNGERFAARSTFTPRRDASGLTSGFLLISSLPPSMDGMVIGACDELQTPLNAVVGIAGTMLMRLPGPLTDDQETQMQTIRNSARHMLSLIDDLQDLARIESGQMDLASELVRGGEVLQEVAATLRPMAESRGLTFLVEVPKEDVVLATDRRALAQILLNLAGNAIKFTESGKVHLELFGPATKVEFRVRDTGIGIRPEDRSRLFEAFAPIHRSSARRYEGTGLGLHLSQKLAHLMGARITFQGDYGKGSLFTLAFDR